MNIYNEISKALLLESTGKKISLKESNQPNPDLLNILWDELDGRDMGMVGDYFFNAFDMEDTELLTIIINNLPQEAWQAFEEYLSDN